MQKFLSTLKTVDTRLPQKKEPRCTERETIIVIINQLYEHRIPDIDKNTKTPQYLHLLSHLGVDHKSILGRDPKWREKLPPPATWRLIPTTDFSRSIHTTLKDGALSLTHGSGTPKRHLIICSNFPNEASAPGEGTQNSYTIAGSLIEMISICRILQRLVVWITLISYIKALLGSFVFPHVYSSEFTR